MRPLATRFIVGIGFVALPAMAQAQTLTVNGLVDLGLSVPWQTTSWMKGGFGKLDNGGGGRGGIAPIGQGLTDLHLELDPSLGVFATARFAPDQHAPFDVLEAYGRYQPVSTPNWLWSMKLGAFFAPISLENEGVGWTSPWTLTPSAINSWVGDELRTIGGETTAEWRYQGGALGLTGAVLAGTIRPGRCLPIAAGCSIAGRSASWASRASRTRLRPTPRCARSRSRNWAGSRGGMPVLRSARTISAG
jgi:hypothetical protein